MCIRDSVGGDDRGVRVGGAAPLGDSRRPQHLPRRSIVRRGVRRDFRRGIRRGIRRGVVSVVTRRRRARKSTRGLHAVHRLGRATATTATAAITSHSSYSSSHNDNNDKHDNVNNYNKYNNAILLKSCDSSHRLHTVEAHESLLGIRRTGRGAHRSLGRCQHPTHTHIQTHREPSNTVQRSTP